MTVSILVLTLTGAFVWYIDGFSMDLLINFLLDHAAQTREYRGDGWKYIFPFMNPSRP